MSKSGELMRTRSPEHHLAIDKREHDVSFRVNGDSHPTDIFPGQGGHRLSGLIDGVACRGARAMLGLSQDEVCAEASCGRRLLNDFENGIRIPRDKNVAKIKAALEAFGAVFGDWNGKVAIAVDPDRASIRSPRGRALERPVLADPSCDPG